MPLSTSSAPIYFNFVTHSLHLTQSGLIVILKLFLLNTSFNYSVVPSIYGSTIEPLLILVNFINLFLPASTSLISISNLFFLTFQQLTRIAIGF